MQHRRAASDLEAANGALALLGEPPIGGFDQRRVAAEVCRERYGDVLDAVLRLHDWNFATLWQKPAALPGVTNGSFTYLYALRADTVKVFEVEDLDEDEWEIIGHPTGEIGVYLATDATAPHIKTVWRNENVAAWDALFQMFFQAQLALAVGPRISRDTANAERQEAKAQRELRKARRADRSEQARSTVSRDTSWLAARNR